MSDEESSEGLPTAAYELVKELENGETAEFYYGYDPRTSLSGDIYRDVNSLVRRGDVEALIQDRLEKQEEQVENLTGFDRVNLNDAKARKQELEELLGEVQQDNG